MFRKSKIFWQEAQFSMAYDTLSRVLEEWCGFSKIQFPCAANIAKVLAGGTASFLPLSHPWQWNCFYFNLKYVLLPMNLNIMGIYLEVRNKDGDHDFKYYDFNIKFENIVIVFLIFCSIQHIFTNIMHVFFLLLLFSSNV